MFIYFPSCDQKHIQFVNENGATNSQSLERDKTMELLAKAEARARELEVKSLSLLSY